MVRVAESSGIQGPLSSLPRSKTHSYTTAMPGASRERSRPFLVNVNVKVAPLCLLPACGRSACVSSLLVRVRLGVSAVVLLHPAKLLSPPQESDRGGLHAQLLRGNVYTHHCTAAKGRGCGKRNGRMRTERVRRVHERRHASPFAPGRITSPKSAKKGAACANLPLARYRALHKNYFSRGWW